MTQHQAPIYLVEYFGDIAGGEVGKYGYRSRSVAHGIAFRSLETALAAIATDFPIDSFEDLDGNASSRRSGPDPEDDRILVWEILPSQHRKVVWHFSGWHWSYDEYGPQGSLPGDPADLYSMVTD